MCGDTGSDYSDWVSSDELANIDTKLGNYGVDLNTITDGATTVADTGGEASIDFDWTNASDYSNEGRNYQAPETIESYQSDFNENYSNEGRDNAELINSVTSKTDDTSAWDKAANFLGDKKNEKLLSTTFDLGKGLYGIYEGKQKDKQARKDKLEQREYDERLLKLKAELAAGRGGGGGSSALELLAAKDALEQAQNARYSASITGLKKPGLINGGRRLTYVGGKPVYTDDGRLK